LGMAARNDAVVIGKLSVDDLADELDIREPESDLIREHVDRDRRLALLEELAELEHRLARQDHLLTGVAAGNRNARVRQPVPVGVSMLSADSSGSARSRSWSLRAPTVTDWSCLPASSLLAVICISRSVAVTNSRPSFCSSSTFARIGSVWRRSTIPETACKGR